MAKRDNDNALQTRHDERLVLRQCKTKEDVMTLEENLVEDIYMQSLVCSQVIENVVTVSFITTINF